MAVITYTASRALVDGHEVGESYVIEVPMAHIDLVGTADLRRHTALSGTAETVFNRIDEEWDFQTVRVGMDTAMQLREFIHSCLGGETFTIDPYGTEDEMDDPFDAILVSNSFSPRRVGTMHDFQIPFRCRRV